MPSAQNSGYSLQHFNQITVAYCRLGPLLFFSPSHKLWAYGDRQSKVKGDLQTQFLKETKKLNRLLTHNNI